MFSVGIRLDSILFALKDLISKTRQSILFLSETKIHDMDDFYRLARGLNDFGFSHSEEVLSGGRSGSFGLFWGDNVKVRVRSKSARFIDAELGGPGDPCWQLTGFYGHLKTAMRHLSWETIRELSDQDVLPWALVDDFNEILHADEKQDGQRK